MATSDHLPSHPTNKDGRATDSCFTIPHPAIERTVTLTTASLYLLLLKPPVFYLRVDTEATSHPALPSVWHTDEAQQLSGTEYNVRVKATFSDRNI